jgi:hypothetical protein
MPQGVIDLANHHPVFADISLETRLPKVRPQCFTDRRLSFSKHGLERLELASSPLRRLRLP